MPLLKIPFLLASAAGVYVSMTPPNPRPLQNQVNALFSKRERVFSAVARIYHFGAKFVICSGALFEAAVIIARLWPAHAISQRIMAALIFGPSSLADQITVSPMFVVGSTIAAVSGFIRYRCYRELGRMFTFELSIQDDHKLVTGGPYAIVRHPSYPAAIACVAGLGIAYGTCGSWVRECGVMDTVTGRVAAWVYSGLWVYGSWNALRRTVEEDAILKARFGSQWDE
ncbi:uncharacterized protein FIBRA_08893 [Fibroporia radiculosa]|uniref:Protein-S-isoprenylcysteine O-methyltransferase n=1 Tax=Fibroporia radiculosa TaxID=599839 RepID=J4H5E8_9APHY|nr:uncharacterized protein FIBRA_08893 [Fibroporia radiculosa]CCM06614.1 predicted protein [Fibroporia radiculosa]